MGQTDTAIVELLDQDLEDPAFDTEILAGQLAPSTMEIYRRTWNDYLDYCSWEETALQPSSLARWRTHLAENTSYAPSTINGRIYGVKRLMREAALQGYIKFELAAQFATISGVRARALRHRHRVHPGVRISPEDMRRICAAPDQSTLKGKRDAALLATLASSGVRISEIAALKTTDIYERNGGYLISVIGKTDLTPRLAPLSREAYNLLQKWLAARTVTSCYVFNGWLGKGTYMFPTPIFKTSVWKLVKHYARMCNLPDVKPHDFRRFVGTQLAARDLRQAQRALGHKDINTTARFYVLDELQTGLTDDLY